MSEAVGQALAGMRSSLFEKAVELGDFVEALPGRGLLLCPGLVPRYLNFRMRRGLAYAVWIMRLCIAAGC